MMAAITFGGTISLTSIRHIKIYTGEQSRKSECTERQTGLKKGKADKSKYNLKLIGKLFANGLTDEKDIVRLGVKDMLKLPGITTAEMQGICELQDAIAERRIFSFLCDAKDKKYEN